MKKVLALMVAVAMMLGVVPADVTFAQVITESKDVVKSSGEEFNVQVDKSQDIYGEKVYVYKYDKDVFYNQEDMSGSHPSGTIQFFLCEMTYGEILLDKVDVSVKDLNGEEIPYTTEVIKLESLEGIKLDRVVYTVNLQKDIIISFKGVELNTFTISASESEDDEYQVKNVRRIVEYQEEPVDENTEGEWKTEEVVVDGEYNEDTDKIEYKLPKWGERVRYDVEVKGDTNPIVNEKWKCMASETEQWAYPYDQTITLEGNTVYHYEVTMWGDLYIDVSSDVHDINVEYVTSNGQEYVTYYMGEYWYIVDKEEYDEYEDWKNSDDDSDFELEYSFRFRRLKNRVALDKCNEVKFNCDTFVGKKVDNREEVFLSAKNEEGAIIALDKNKDDSYSLPTGKGYCTLVVNMDMLVDAYGWVTIDNRLDGVDVRVDTDEYVASSNKESTYFTKRQAVVFTVTADTKEELENMCVYSWEYELTEVSISDLEKEYTLSRINDDTTVIIGRPATAKVIKKKDFSMGITEGKNQGDAEETDEYIKRGIYSEGATPYIHINTDSRLNYDINSMIIKQTYVENGVRKEIFYDKTKFGEGYANDGMYLQVELKAGENEFSISSITRKKYKVSIPSNPAYTITNIKGIPNSIEHGTDYSFRIIPSSTYDLSNITVVLDGGIIIKPVNGVYTIQNIKQNYTVGINGYKQKTSTVIFKSYNGKTLSTQTVVYGKGATAPKAPARKGYKFKGWSTSYSNIKKDTVVTAKYSPIYVTKVKVSGSINKLAAGKKVTLKVAVAPSNALTKSVKWSTSNKKYATVSSKGVVTAKKAGAGKTVTITAKAKDGSGKKATFKIKIYKNAVKKVTLSAKSKTVKAGKKVTIKAKVTPTSGVNKTLKWSVSNKKYATVNSKGVVTTKKAGKKKTVTVTAVATDGSGKKGTIKIKIK